MREFARKNTKSLFLIGAVIWIILLGIFYKQSVAVQVFSDEDHWNLLFRENTQDIPYVIYTLLNKTQKSISCASFAFQDKRFAAKLQDLKNKNVCVSVLCDPKQKNLFSKQSRGSFSFYRGSGLMHEKILCIDREILCLGSTNMTESSLYKHKNLLCLIRSYALSDSILKREFYSGRTFSFYPLPQYGKKALFDLIQKIEKAKSHIHIAMYSLTHPKILQALVTAKKRNVFISIYIDRSMTKGVCKKAVQLLQKEKIFVFTPTSSGLLHHKCAWIDDAFILGSCNWSKAGFHKNQEYILQKQKLYPDEKQKVKGFFQHLQRSSISVAKIDML